MDLTPLITDLPALPILIPLAGGVIGLLVGRRPRLQAACTIGAMILSLCSAGGMYALIRSRQTPLVMQFGGWPAPFGITLVGDLCAVLFVLMSQLVWVAGVIYAVGSRDRCVRYPTFLPLFMFMATGLSGAFLTGDMFTLFVFIELLALSSTVLTAIADDRHGVEAAYKYFYISQFAAFALLLANGALYVSCGVLNMADVAARIPTTPFHGMIRLAVTLLTAAFLIKSAAFPFHFWQPDFHSAAPTAVSAMLSAVVVKLGVYGLIRSTTLWFVHDAATIQTVLIYLGAAGIVYGGLAAVGTHHVKRMLAYSTMAQVGFILVAVGWGTPRSLAAAIVFTFNHSLIKSALLMLAGYMAGRAPAKSASFESLKGVGKPHAAAGALFLIGALALAGIPPTNGFISKLLFFYSGIQIDQTFLILVIGVSSLFTLIYTSRAFIHIWWADAPETISAPRPGDSLLAPALLILVAVILGVWPDPLIEAATEAGRTSIDALIDIQAVSGG